MARTYEHTFADLRSDQSDPEPSVVDLGPETRAQDPTGTRINPAPGNPDAGKADQFDDVTPAPKGEPDDGVDVELQDASDLADETEVTPTDEVDEDLSRLSKPQRDRIMRERRLRQESEERSRRLEAELAQVNQKIDLQGKEAEWRTADEKDDQALTDLRAQKIKAMEEGQTAQVVDLDDKILDLKAAKKSRDEARAAAREAAKKSAQPKTPGVNNPKAQAWLDKHPQYQTDPLFREAVHAADRLLYSQGFNVNSDDYYVRMSRMLSESGKFDIDPTYLKGAKRQGGSPRGGGSHGVRQGNTGAVRRGDNGRVSVTITKEDKALLASMGQDPDDPSVLRAYAREKVAQQRAEAAARGER